MSKITLKNISSGMVVVVVPDIGFRRELIPGRVIPITEQEYDALIFDPGVDALIQGHYIIFNGVEEGEAPITTSPVYEATNIKKTKTKSGYTFFKTIFLMLKIITTINAKP